MDLQTLLNERNLSKYQLSKLSGVPKTTIMDICAGRSDMERCNAKTVQKLAQALNCTMEDMMKLSSPYDEKGLPKDRSYLECGLPEFLQESIQAMVKAWQKVDQWRELYALGLRLLQSAKRHQQRGGQPDHQPRAGVVSP